MDYCSICKSRYTWDCEDERETGRTKCDDFELDFSALDSDTKSLLEKIVALDSDTKNLLEKIVIKIKEEYEE